MLCNTYIFLLCFVYLFSVWSSQLYLLVNQCCLLFKCCLAFQGSILGWIFVFFVCVVTPVHLQMRHVCFRVVRNFNFHSWVDIQTYSCRWFINALTFIVSLQHWRASGIMCGLVFWLHSVTKWLLTLIIIATSLDSFQIIMFQCSFNLCNSVAFYLLYLAVYHLSP